MRQFWGQQQRFFKEMASASKVEFVVAQTKEALESGMSVVIGLQSTGESGMDKVGITCWWFLFGRISRRNVFIVLVLVCGGKYYGLRLGVLGIMRRVFCPRCCELRGRFRAKYAWYHVGGMGWDECREN